MVKYRIKIEKVEKRKYTHIKNIMIETNNIKNTINKITKAIKKEIEKRKEMLTAWINNKVNYIKNHIKITDKDLIDFKSKGKNISKEDYLKNEMWFDIYG